MNQRALPFLLYSLIGLAACAPKTPDDAAQAASTAAAVLPQPAIGSFGVDLAALDPSVDPGDDFIRYAGGRWYDTFQLPVDHSSYGSFTALAERSDERVKAIIDELVSTEGLNGEAKLIADFYHSYMDVETINSRGIEPIRPVLADIDAIDSVDALARQFGRYWLTGSESPLRYGMWYDRLDPDTYQLSVSVGGLGLPDRDYYLGDAERFAAIREAYRAHIVEMLDFAGIAADAAAAQADAILELETRIASIQWPREKRRNRDLTLNPIDRPDLAREYPGFDWDLFFAESGYRLPRLNVSQPQPLRDLIGIVNDSRLEDWKAYLRYHTIRNNAALLAEDVYDANFDFYGRTLYGQQEPRERWERAISQMSGTQSLGFAIGKLYVERHFPESSKQQVLEMVENIRTALAQRVERLDWMGPETKREAKAKLLAFRPKIGYPDEWESLEGLEISRDDLVGNVQALRRFFRDKSVAREFEVTDRNRWAMTPQRVNAYYNSAFNEIVFPAAILQPPFFDPNADPAVNYGAIGGVIGHEMGHGFDDQGSKADARGVQRNWWTAADRAAFEARTQQLVEQYSAYEPIEGHRVNGRNALGENIGDVGGLAMAYEGWRLSLAGEEPAVIDGFTGDQRFFLGWAQIWRTQRTEQSMLNQLRAGTHTPSRYRKLAVRNHDAWYTAFDVTPDDALYLAPEERVRIW